MSLSIKEAQRLGLIPKPEKRTTKYRNRKTVYQNIQFDSLKEANRYRELQLMEQAGLIKQIELQPRYDLIVNGCKLGFYRGDFRYVDVKTGKSVTEDAKGVRTQVYILKKKLVKAIYGIDIVEV